MKRRTIITAVILTLFSTGLCFADTLVITYRSGKTQTITLNEPSTTINSWQFVGGTTAAPAQQPQAVLQPPAAQATPKTTTATPANEDNKLTNKAPEKKSGVRFNWNAKPISD